MIVTVLPWRKRRQQKCDFPNCGFSCALGRQSNFKVGPLLTLFSNLLPTPLLTRPLKNCFYRHFGVSNKGLEGKGPKGILAKRIGKNTPESQEKGFQGKFRVFSRCFQCVYFQGFQGVFRVFLPPPPKGPGCTKNTTSTTPPRESFFCPTFWAKYSGPFLSIFVAFFLPSCET